MTLIPVKMRSGKRCIKCNTGKNVAWLDDYGNAYCTDCKCRLQDKRADEWML
jgi:uncharacterized paraquat-inducible protein A